MKYYQRTKPAPSGRPMANEYSRIADKSGKVVLTKTGEVNIHQQIQEQNKFLNLRALVKRHALGDTSAIPAAKPFEYTDLTQMPKSLLEARQVLVSAERTFNAQPSELKQKYNNDFTTFLKEVDVHPNGNPEVIKRLQQNIAKKNEGGNVTNE